jgi:hypothetical protein
MKMLTAIKHDVEAENDARGQVERELQELVRMRQNVPELDELRGRMPQLNGDQDTW